MADASRPATKLSAFVIVQAVLICTAVAAAAHRLRQLDARDHLPPLRSEPLTVSPTYDYSWVVSDQQLQDVLYQLRPRLAGPRPKINHVDHALRFWGVEATFHDPQCLSGEQLRTLLTDHRAYAEVWGEDEPPLLRFTEDGVRIRTREGRATASHVDHTVAGLAEVGTPLDHLIVTPTRRATMGDLVRYTLRDFQLNQAEYEWSALTFALYLPPNRSFVTEDGQQVDFDTLADRLMRQRYREGVCAGNHRLHTLTMLLRIDEQHDILSDLTHADVMGHLREASQRLVANQHPDGYWNRRWSGQLALNGAPTDDDSLTARILATGHALEWLALAPQELHPPRENLVRAGQWLSRTIIELDESTVTELYTYLTHAGRALALWRGKTPAEFLPLPADVAAHQAAAPENAASANPSLNAANEEDSGGPKDSPPQNISEPQRDRQP